MSQVSRSVEIEASPKECYAVITDYEKYPEFLKDLKEVSVGKKSGQNAEVTFVVDLIKKVTYTLAMRGKPPAHLGWTLVRGDLIKKNDGEWVLEELEDGLTRATYTLDISFGLFVPGPISKMLAGSHLPAMLESFKKRIESLKKEKKKK